MAARSPIPMSRFNQRLSGAACGPRGFSASAGVQTGMRPLTRRKLAYGVCGSQRPGAP